MAASDLNSRTMLLAPGDSGELVRWAVAGALVLAMHAAAVGGYLLRGPSEPEGAAESPAVIVDLAPMPVAPSSQADLAPGPEMVEAMPAPKPPPQTKPEVADPVEKIEAPAEVTLPLPEPKAEQEKPKEEPDPQPTKTETVRQDQTPAPQTTAAPRSEQKSAERPAAPSPGSAASRAAMASWRDLLVARLQQNKRYPHSAEARGEQGVVTLSFSVDRNGKVLSRSIAKSSGVTALDEEVLAMVARAQPLPAFPPAMAQNVVHLTVPIRFSLR